jgi:methionyl-tRNA formyltransferase
MRVLFLGSPGRFSARALRGCLDAGYEVCEFWYGRRTRDRAWRADRRLGWFNPGWSVAAALQRSRIPAVPVPPLRTAPQLGRRAVELEADLLVSAEFPYVVPATMLDQFPGRAVNLHPALLPDYRGPNPVLGMLHHEQVDRCGGVTLHQMAPELDAGPIIDRRHAPWNPRGFRHWEADLGRAAYELTRESLPLYARGGIQPCPQQPVADVYFRGLDAEALRIDGRRTAQRAKYLLDSIGSYLALQAHAAGRSWKVARFLDIVADRPLGSPARIGPTRIELDVADARIAVQRWLPGTSKIRQWQTFRLFAGLAP